MRISVRNFRGLPDWADFELSGITAVYGPNSSGKSGLVSAFLLLLDQRDIFRLSFAGGAHGLPGFLDALGERDPDGRLDFVLRAVVDAAAAIFPAGAVRPEPVPYEFELALSYAGDPFDGMASGLLAEASVSLVGGREKRELFFVRPAEGGVELGLGLSELLLLPFVHERAVAADEDLPDEVARIDRSVASVAGLARGAFGEVSARAKTLLASLQAARKEAALNRELERIVLPEPPPERFAPRWLRSRDRVARIQSAELRYLRGLCDVFVAQSLEEAGIRSLRSRESGREIRPSFYSAFYEILAAAGFLSSSRPPRLARFPARLPSGAADPRGSRPGLEGATAVGARALARSAAEDWAALLRDAIGVAACRGPDGRCAIEEARLQATYGETAIAFREAHGGLPLVREGGPADQHILDLEGRREALRAFLSRHGVADDLEFLPRGSEDRAICLARGGRRVPLGELGSGIERLVLVAASLLYLPWGSLVLVEDPESGLDEGLQAAMADLFRLLAEKSGASVLVETRSSAFVRALGLRAERGADRVAEGAAAEGEAGRASATRMIDGMGGGVRLIELRPPGDSGA